MKYGIMDILSNLSRPINTELVEEAATQIIDQLIKALEAEAIEVDRWVGENQSTGYSETFKAVRLTRVKQLLLEEGKNDIN